MNYSRATCLNSPLYPNLARALFYTRRIYKVLNRGNFHIYYREEVLNLATMARATTILYINN